MSTLIPTLGAARFDARGELRLAERLKDCLEDNSWEQLGTGHGFPIRRLKTKELKTNN
jgi:hypothetical protein